MNRICRDCGEEKPLTTEFFEKRTDNGLYRHICKTCQNSIRALNYKIKFREKIDTKNQKILEEDFLFSNGKFKCQHCNQIQLLRNFNKHKQGRLGIDTTCKSCKQHMKDKRLKESCALRTCRKCGIKASNTDGLELFVKTTNGKFGRYNLCKLCHTSDDAMKRHNNSIDRRCKKFGISVDEYNSMVKEQNNCCYICNKPKELFEGRGNNFHIDHCHTSGKVRGLLCSNCNTGLGQFKDNIHSLENAIQYLIKNV